MNSKRLADSVESVVAQAQDRIVGSGHEQYSSGDTQLFETLPLDELYDYLKEELLDIINYSVMLTIRLDRIRKIINDQSGKTEGHEFRVQHGTAAGQVLSGH